MKCSLTYHQSQNRDKKNLNISLTLKDIQSNLQVLDAPELDPLIVRDGGDDFAGSWNVETLDRKAALVMPDGPDETVRVEMNGTEKKK